jgi:AraC family transcriptional regulator, ethanolamine operon transcriptional activator
MTPDPAPADTAPVPAPRTTQLLTFDPEVMTLALQQGVLEHVQLEPGLFRGQIAHTATADSRVDWGRYALSVLARGDLSDDMVSVTMALEGQGDWRVQGQRVETGDMAIFAEGGELLVALPARAQWLSMQVPRSRLEALGLYAPLRLASGVARIRGAIAPGLQRSLAGLAPVLAPHDTPRRGEAAAIELAHAELMSTLLGELARRVDSGGGAASLAPGERWKVIRRAEAYLESRGDESVRIDDLCVAACTSLSRLERAFREAFGVSPRRYLALRRLAAVRRELLRGEANLSVTEVATRWGFFHLGRFSQEYRLLYGERPSQTLATPRAGR